MKKSKRLQLVTSPNTLSSPRKWYFYKYVRNNRKRGLTFVISNASPLTSVIEIDLDEGVKVYSEKFQGLKMPLDNGKTETMDLLAKI